MTKVTCLALALTAACHGAYAAEPPLTALALTPRGQSLVTASQKGLQRFSWPMLQRQETIEADAPNLHCLAFSPDRKRLAVGGGQPAENGVVEVLSWPAAESQTTLAAHADSVRAVVWVDDATIVTASIDRSIKRWNLETKACELVLDGHSRSVNALCLLPDGQTLVSSGDDQSVRVWNIRTGELIRSLNQHTEAVHALALRPAKEGLPMVASAAEDRTIRLWQPTIGRMVRYARLEAAPLCIAWQPDGQRILAGCDDGQVRVIDPERVTVERTLEAIDGWTYAIAAHPSDNSAAVGGSGGQPQRITLP